MHNPEFITFTGIDDRTDLDAVEALSKRYPVEWGVLFSPTQQGRTPRYPGLARLSEIHERSRSLRLAAHLCGEHARRIVGGSLLPDLPAVLTGVYERVQVNHPYAVPHRIASFGEMARIACIGQFMVGPFPSNDSIQWLFDASSGAGIVPAVWPMHPGGDRLVGHAGGIGPDNVSVILDRINSAGRFWIDMETRVRTDDDWLDLAKCEAVCVQVYG